MVRHLPILVGIILLFSHSAKAQGGIDVFGGYSYERLDSSPARNLNGVEIAGQYKFTNWIGVAGDFDAHFASAPDTRTLHFLVGPQISLPARISPFAHILGGVGHLRFSSLTDTSVAAAIGGGIDMRLAPVFSWRNIQADDVITRFFGTTQHNARVSTGIVFRF